MAVQVRERAPSHHLRPDPRPFSLRTFAAIFCIWIFVLIALNQWGNAINDRLTMKVLAPPLAGHFDLGLSWRLILPVALAALVIGFAHRVVQSLGWRPLLGTAALAAVAWALALALVGPASLTHPLERHTDYLANLPLVGDLGGFLDGYAGDLEMYTVHAEGHPPGALLFFWGLDRIGLDGAGPAAVLILIAAASTVPAVLLSIREIAGEEPARRAAPFLVLTPAAIWIATSMDAVFMAVGAWGICLMVVAMKRRGARSDAAAIASGAVFGVGLFMSYGLVPLGLVVVSLAVTLRRVRPLVVAVATLFLVAGIFAAAGFWWFDGLSATRARYEAGVSSQRPYSYFLIGNLAALSVALGPVVLVGLARLRNRGIWILCGGALAAAAVADLSGLSKGEVERIWLPFIPWLTVAAASLPAAGVRTMLGVQSAVALALQVGIRTPW
jgi:hypothetical protein